jgi:hypothetical protein
MNISVHIERLVLDGLSLPRRDRARLQIAVEEELARLLVSGSLASDLRSPGLLSSVTGGTVEVPSDEAPHLLGKRIAQAIYRGIGS